MSDTQPAEPVAEGQEPTATPEAAQQVDAQQPVNPDTPQTVGQEPKPEGNPDNHEAAKYRVRLREQEKVNQQLEEKLNGILQGLGKLSGHVPEEDTQIDPDEAIKAATERAAQSDQRAEAAEAKARALHVTSDIRDKAKEAGINDRLLIPLLKGEGQLDNLDPEADDFESQVDAVIAKAQEKYPELVAQVAPRSSGQAPTPTDNAGSKITREDLATMTSAEINKAAAEGKLNHLMNK